MALRWTRVVYDSPMYRLPFTTIGPFAGQLLFEVWALTARRESATIA